MYCKHCGKQIDDDSKFCKECGKNLSNDTSNSINPFSISSIKPYILSICFTVIWYALTMVFTFGVYGYNYRMDRYNESPIGMLVLLWITPLVYYLAYNMLTKFSKYPIKLWNNADKQKTKIFKAAYLLYSYFVPFGCCEHNQIDEYLSLMFLLWLLPSIIIYLIYFIKSSKSHS